MPKLATVLSSLLLASLASAQLQCGSQSAGSSCGPQITVTFTPNGVGGNYDMLMVGTGLQPHAPGVFNWGFNQLNIQLPGGCMILCDRVWGHSFMTDPTGLASWSRSWPHWATIQFYMQMGSLEQLPSGALSIQTTDCVLAGCL